MAIQRGHQPRVKLPVSFALRPPAQSLSPSARENASFYFLNFNPTHSESVEIRQAGLFLAIQLMHICWEPSSSRSAARRWIRRDHLKQWSPPLRADSLQRKGIGECSSKLRYASVMDHLLPPNILKRGAIEL
jgi:hypothetical protein